MYFQELDLLLVNQNMPFSGTSPCIGDPENDYFLGVLFSLSVASIQR